MSQLIRSEKMNAALTYLLLVHVGVWGQSGSGDLQACGVGEFNCASSGLCISEQLLCDGQDDCPLGEDESVCPRLTCSLDQFRCESGGEEICLSLQQVCDGIADCTDGRDEATCGDAPAGSSCQANEFTCSLSRACVPLAFLCNGVGECPNGEDESRCESPEAAVQVLEDISVTAGDTITLPCDVIGYPPSFVTWRKDLAPLPQSPRYNFTSQNGFGVLRILDSGLEDAGQYHCEVVSTLHGTRLVLPAVQVSVEDASPSVCTDHLDQQYSEGAYYYDARPVGVGPASQAAADIVFVVDESGSMALEHQWIRDEARLLDRLMQERGVGAGQRNNLFALVGFGRDDPNAILGITLTQPVVAGEFVSASEDLVLTGLFEDGYAAVDYAIENIVTRPDTAKIMILVTDEDRGVLRTDLSRDGLENSLRAAGYVLNVVVNQGFESDSAQFALGLTNDVAYLFDPFSSEFFTVVGADNITPSDQFRFGNTYEDYVQLALSLGGTAWDLNQLREEGLFARAFSNAFSVGKVQEVMLVFSQCFGCLCLSLRERCELVSDVSVQDCSGTFPVLRSAVSPEAVLAERGSPVSFECLSYTNLPNVSVTYSWVFPSELAPELLIGGPFLMVTEADVDSPVSFMCEVTVEGLGLVSTANATLTIDTRCVLPDWSYLVLGDVRLILAPQASNLSRAADVVLLVDESGSMLEEHAWIPAMTRLLDQALQEVEVGVEPRNRFGVVGFGDDCTEGSVLGRVLLSSAQEAFAVADNISDFTRDLNVGGREEDGYSAIEVALESYEFRDVARQFILITDEDRDVLTANLTRDSVREMLEDSDVLLNAVINQEFLGGVDARALGVDGNGDAYVYAPSRRLGYEVLEGSGVARQDSAHGSTGTDYTQLALELGGAAWDLSQLRQGGGVAEAFTNAFVQVKILEIQSQLSTCMNCTCGVDGPVCNPLPNANFSFCMRTPDVPHPDEGPLAATIEGPTEVTISPTETRTFTCRVNGSAVIRWTFNGGNLPSNVEVLGVGGYQSILTIGMATVANAGVYSCVVHSQSGTFGDTATLQTIFYDPEQDLMLMLSPLQSAVTRGNNFTFSCTVQSSADISWQFEDGLLPLNADVTTADMTSLLTLVSIEHSNTGTYTCTANTTGGVVNEDTAYLEVMDPVLKLVVDADVVSVEEGMLGELVCRVDCFCPGVLPEWSRPDSTPLPNNSLVLVSDADVVEVGEGIETSLLIPSITVEDGGRYFCTAQLNGDTVAAEAYFNITKVERFEVDILGMSLVEIEEGDFHSLVCETNQNASSIVWSFNGTQIQVQGADPGDVSASTDNLVAIEVSPSRTVLSVLQADLLNSGAYQCTATSELDNEVMETFVELVVN